MIVFRYEVNFLMPIPVTNISECVLWDGLFANIMVPVLQRF